MKELIVTLDRVKYSVSALQELLLAIKLLNKHTNGCRAAAEVLLEQEGFKKHGLDIYTTQCFYNRRLSDYIESELESIEALSDRQFKSDFHQMLQYVDKCQIAGSKAVIEPKVKIIFYPEVKYRVFVFGKSKLTMEVLKRTKAERSFSIVLKDYSLHKISFYDAIELLRQKQHKMNRSYLELHNVYLDIKKHSITMNEKIRKQPDLTDFTLLIQNLVSHDILY